MVGQLAPRCALHPPEHLSEFDFQFSAVQHTGALPIPNMIFNTAFLYRFISVLENAHTLAAKHRDTEMSCLTSIVPHA